MACRTPCAKPHRFNEFKLIFEGTFFTQSLAFEAWALWLLCRRCQSSLLNWSCLVFDFLFKIIIQSSPLVTTCTITKNLCWACEQQAVSGSELRPNFIQWLWTESKIWRICLQNLVREAVHREMQVNQVLHCEPSLGHTFLILRTTCARSVRCCKFVCVSLCRCDHILYNHCTLLDRYRGPDKVHTSICFKGYAFLTSTRVSLALAIRSLESSKTPHQIKSSSRADPFWWLKPWQVFCTKTPHKSNSRESRIDHKDK